MALADGSAWRVSDGTVFLVNDGKKRRVPNRQTLVALKLSPSKPSRAEAKELAQMELGDDIPSLFEGNTLIDEEGNASVVRLGQVVSIPDAATLASIGRLRVQPIRTADTLIASLRSKMQMAAAAEASQEAVEIDTYIRSLAPLPSEGSSDTHGPDEVRPGSETIEGVPIKVTERIVTMKREVADFIEIQPVSDVLWPGALVTGASVVPGSLAPIALSRAPGTITITTDLTANAKSQSRTLNAPSLSTYRDTLDELIADLDPTSSSAAVRYRTQQISSLEEGMVSFGLNLKGAGWGVDAKANLAASCAQSHTFGMFSQVYYQVAFTPSGSPPKFFDEDVTLAEVKQYCGPDNPPCYIASVSYGRCFIFYAKSKRTYFEVKAAVEGYWKSGVSGNVQVDGSYKNVLDETELTAVVVGGSSGAVGQAIADPGANLLGWIQQQLDLNAGLPLSPIEYTVRYLAPPHNLVKITRVAKPVKIVDANVYDPRESVGQFEVGDGQGKGPVNTGIRLRKGDELIVTATGSIWAGWIFIGSNGPDGLSGPAPDYYPLPQSPGSSLLGGYDNSKWFFVGSGYRGKVPDIAEADLWLRLNDENMQNGKGHFNVNVDVRRRMPTIPGAS